MKINFGFLKYFKVLTFLIIGLLYSQVSFAQNKAGLTLFDFEKGFNVSQLELIDAKIKTISEGNNHLLYAVLGNQAERPSIHLKLPVTDLSHYIGISMDITNRGTSSIAIEANCFDSSPGTLNIDDEVKYFYRSKIILNPGEKDSLFVVFSRPMESLPDYINQSLKGMFGLPGGFLRRKLNLDLTQITDLAIFKQKESKDSRFTVDNIRAVGKYELPSEETLKNKFFPFVDQFGQYIHKDWPNKTTSVDDIKVQKIEEKEELAKNPGAQDWDKYGGWRSGPSLKATGHFRVEKYKNKWWLVDPDGKLFWSHGINVVRPSQITPVSGRENYFVEIPDKGDFYRANLAVKYGRNQNDATQDVISQNILKRMRSWGINTLAANSDPLLYTYKKTPYTIEIRSGISNPIPDTLDETGFRNLLKERLKRQDITDAANDPWCIGYFVDNELVWSEHNTAEAINSYFKVVQEEMKKFAPNKLYLGCRINSPSFSRLAFAASAKYCDVISINHYDYNVLDFHWTEGIDKPIIIGEFHFGALDRGLFHTGLRSVSNQNQRARVYMDFINQCLKSPIFVGAHWFQYVDQVCTGRADGENYQIGFVDICDRPYPELISTTRKISSYLYGYRLHNSSFDVY